jgi:WD40 repeat protein
MAQKTIKHPNDLQNIRASFTSNGQFLLSSLSNGCMEVRKAENDYPIMHILGEPIQRVFPFAIHPNSEQTIRVSIELLEVWSIKEGTLLKTMPLLDEDEQVHTLCFSPDGKYLIVATDYERVRIFDFETGNLSSEFGAGERNPSLFFNPTGSVLASTSCFPGSSTIAFRTYSNGHVGSTTESLIYSGFDAIVGGQFSTTGKYISFTDKYLKLYEAKSGNLVWVFTSENKRTATPEATGMVEVYWSNPIFLKNETQLICANPSGQINLYNIVDGVIAHTIQAHEGMVYNIEISPDDKYLVSTGMDKRMLILDLNDIH